MQTDQTPVRETDPLLKLLYTLTDGARAQELYSRLLKRFLSPVNVFEAPIPLLEDAGLTHNEALLLSSIPALSNKYYHGDLPTRVTGAKEAAQIFSASFPANGREEALLLCLDANGRFLKNTVVGYGTADRSHIYSETLLRAAAFPGTKAVILAHCHPGGNLMPSDEDLAQTLTCLKTLYPLGVPLLDHLIISGTRYTSIRCGGYLSEELFLAQDPSCTLLLRWKQRSS